MTEPSAHATGPQTASPPQPIPLALLVVMDRQTKQSQKTTFEETAGALSARAEELHGERSVYKPQPECDQLPPVNRQPSLNARRLLDDAAEVWKQQVNTATTMAMSDLQPEARCTILDPETGEVLLKDLPLPALLALDAALTKLRPLIEKMPILPGGHDWEDEPGPDGVYRSQPSLERYVQVQPRAEVGFPGDEHNPPQIKWYNTEVLLGVWETVKLSTALPAETVRTYLKRIDALVMAVREGIYRTNAIVSVEPRSDGDVLARYVFR